MTLWQCVDLTSLFDRESSRPITSLQILEPIDRYSAGASSELEQATLLLCVPSSDHLPEVLDHFVLLLVAAVVGVLLPVLDINIGDTADKEFEFALVKHID